MIKRLDLFNNENLFYSLPVLIYQNTLDHFKKKIKVVYYLVILM